MADEKEIRLRNRLPDSEFERRWKAVQREMEKQKLDFLICQSCSDFLGGYAKWFIDSPSTIYPVTVIFSRDGEITTVCHGPTAPAPPNPPLWTVRGVKKRI